MRKKTTESQLSSEEWDFGNIEEGELFPATAYEYLRSHPFWRSALENWLNSNFGQQWNSQAQFDPELMFSLSKWSHLSVRKALRAAQSGPSALLLARSETPSSDPLGPMAEPTLGEFENMLFRTFNQSFHPLLRLAALQFIDFPTPWLSLKRKPDRRPWDEFRPRPAVVRVESTYFSGDTADAPKKPSRNLGQEQPPRYIFKVLVDRHQPKSAIVRGFGELVAPFLIAEPKNPTGAGRSRQFELLKWLAAYRLRHAQMTREQMKKPLDAAVKESRRRPSALGVSVLPIYQSPQSWSKAIGKARAILSGSPESFLNEIVGTFH